MVVTLSHEIPMGLFKVMTGELIRCFVSVAADPEPRSTSPRSDLDWNRISHIFRTTDQGRMMGLSSLRER